MSRSGFVTSLIAFGSNQGRERETLDETIGRLQQLKGLEIERVSTPVRTRPVGGPPGQADFLNAVIRLSTALTPLELHASTSQIERDLGRIRRQRWGPRPIDLDLLLMGDLQLDLPELQIPHPRMTFRRFVIDPAAEIAGELIHPVCGVTIGQLKQRLDTMPDRVIFVDADQARAEELSRRVADTEAATWEFGLVSQPQQFERATMDAKLVVWGNGLPSPFSSLSFPGPYLELSGPMEQDVVEVASALDAMAGIN